MLQYKLVQDLVKRSLLLFQPWKSCCAGALRMGQPDALRAAAQQAGRGLSQGHAQPSARDHQCDRIGHRPVSATAPLAPWRASTRN